ncbi:hypothetical protein Aph01nite_60830 [Acrocarpospora phusangensis]|uniref:Uncharacterized protein n=1 Tax=Acrocarpospora phusangensis TaxID=1070424 RepID=A0A919QFF0_9ACTN|nr:hypothetical protein [Acrocarpospora phusangensis]GIH27773.1 hypothetical protein Aph01nite_60830 [Acrocarpospora phusangensis]
MAKEHHPLTELEVRLVALAKEHNFSLNREPVQYYCEFVHGDTAVYLDRQRTKRDIIAVFLHPETDLDRLPQDAGLGGPGGIRHAEGLRLFPKKFNKGKRPSSYGYPIICPDLTAFGRLLASLT